MATRGVGDDTSPSPEFEQRLKSNQVDKTVMAKMNRTCSGNGNLTPYVYYCDYWPCDVKGGIIGASMGLDYLSTYTFTILRWVAEDP